jgi:hypothetical protein
MMCTSGGLIPVMDWIEGLDGRQMVDGLLNESTTGWNSVEQMGAAGL